MRGSNAVLALFVLACGGIACSTASHSASPEAGVGGQPGTDSSPDSNGGNTQSDARSEATDNPPDAANDSPDSSTTACPNVVDITASIEATGKYEGTATQVISESSSCGTLADSAATSYLKLHVSEPGNYEVSVDSPGGTNDPSQPDATISIRSSCESNASQFECNVRAAFLSSHFGASQPGDVYLVLHGHWFSNGYTLSIRKRSDCYDDNDCRWDQRYCDAASGACTQCRNNFDCDSRHCTAAYSCVECVGDNDCMNGKCNTTIGTCRGCEADADCKSYATPHCNSENKCVECLTKDDCPGSLRCTPAQFCGCTTNDDCSGGKCNTTTKQCVTCLTPEDCAGNENGHFCGSSGDCGCRGTGYDPQNCEDSPKGTACVYFWGEDMYQCGCADDFACPNMNTPRCGWLHECIAANGSTCLDHSTSAFVGDDGLDMWQEALDITPGAAPSTQEVTGHYTCSDEDVDWFKFAVDAGDTIKVTVHWSTEPYRVPLVRFFHHNQIEPLAPPIDGVSTIHVADTAPYYVAVSDYTINYEKKDYVVRITRTR